MSVPPQEQDEIARNLSIERYLRAHSGPNGGWRGFFKSNLFAALVIWLITQVGFLVAMYWRVSGLIEWKGGVDKTLEEFRTQGSPALRKEVEFHARENATNFGALDARVSKVERDTEHFDVMEAENRRITEALEKLKNDKK